MLAVGFMTSWCPELPNPEILIVPSPFSGLGSPADPQRDVVRMRNDRLDHLHFRAFIIMDLVLVIVRP